MYRTICTELWTDPEIRKLPLDAKALFVYLITNPHTHLSGIYYLPLTTIQEELRMKRYRIDTLLHTLSIPRLAWFDSLTMTVFVTNMFHYQGRGPKNYASAAEQLRTLHHSSLIQKFIERYPAIVPLISDTLSIPYTSSPVPDPDPIPSSLSDLPEREESEKRERPWLEILHENPAYQHIDFTIEFGKMRAWLALPKNKARKLTKAFALNWLNKIDPPLANGQGQANMASIPPFPGPEDPIARHQWRQAYGDPTRPTRRA